MVYPNTSQGFSGTVLCNVHGTGRVTLNFWRSFCRAVELTIRVKCVCCPSALEYRGYLYCSLAYCSCLSCLSSSLFLRAGPLPALLRHWTLLVVIVGFLSCLLAVCCESSVLSPVVEHGHGDGHAGDLSSFVSPPHHLSAIRVMVTVPS